MANRRASARSLRRLEDLDVPLKISPGLIAVYAALSTVGMIMLISNNQLGDECKMEAIDKSFTGVTALMACVLALLVGL